MAIFKGELRFSIYYIHIDLRNRSFGPENLIMRLIDLRFPSLFQNVLVILKSFLDTHVVFVFPKQRMRVGHRGNNIYRVTKVQNKCPLQNSAHATHCADFSVSCKATAIRLQRHAMPKCSVTNCPNNSRHVRKKDGV